jgi:hypothetical protein
VANASRDDNAKNLSNLEVDNVLATHKVGFSRHNLDYFFKGYAAYKAGEAKTTKKSYVIFKILLK